uniref:Membrane-bound metal-dependent hydrolase n=1 Tax=Solibacter usitatus (strain Ellin6076) TaxID=234267 RepID=Q01PN8_SOLUE
MASAITHFVVGAGLALPAMELPALRGVMPRWALPVTTGLFAVVPDLDTYAMLGFGIPRGTLLSHRGFFHSPFFLALLAGVVAAIVARGAAFRWLAIVWAAAAITHPLLDMLTDGGSGVMLLFPVTTERLFFPWRPIRVSPLSVARFFDRAGEILWSELPFCAAAVALGLAARSLLARSLRRG